MSRDRRCASIPALTNHFSFVRKLGQGSFSDVYLIRLKASVSQQYALKSLVRSIHPKRAETELRILRQLGGRNNMVQFVFSFRKDDQIFICLEYIPHVQFQAFCEDASIVEIRDYIKNLLIALRFLHDNGIIHHDVKPSNFLYDRQRKRYALIDFGLAEEMAPPAFLPQPKKEQGTSGVIVRGKRKLDFQQESAASSTSAKRNEQRPRELVPGSAPKLSISAASPSSGRYGYLLLQMKEEKPVAPVTLSLPTTSTSSTAHVSPDSCRCFGRCQYCSICLSRRFPEVNHAGTAGFRAPETLMNAGPEYQTYAIDIWACGIILLSLLSRRYPVVKPKHSGDSLAAIMTLMGAQNVAATAKILGVKVLHQELCVRLDLRELCCFYRLQDNISGVASNNHRPKPCTNCSNNFKEDLSSEREDLPSADRKLFCFCHTGRREHRGPLFVHCVNTEFGKDQQDKKGNVKLECKEGQDGEEPTARGNYGLMFDQAFDLLESLLELTPSRRIRAGAALSSHFFDD